VDGASLSDAITIFRLWFLADSFYSFNGLECIQFGELRYLRENMERRGRERNTSVMNGMHRTGYGISDLVADIRVITADAEDEREIIGQVCDLAAWLSRNTEGWLHSSGFVCDREQGFSRNLLHEEPDRSLAVYAVTWWPGGGTPPHDHSTWEVVAPVIGASRHVTWMRSDDRSVPGCASIERSCDFLVRPGEAVSVTSSGIHNVVNEGGDMGLSLHIYGRTERPLEPTRFDPETHREDRFMLRVG